MAAGVFSLLVLTDTPANANPFFFSTYFRRTMLLEAENARLKKLIAERDLEIEVMKEVAAKNW